MNYLVQTGLLNEIAIFRSNAVRRFQRDCEVVCRTQRGLEVGQIVTESDSNSSGQSGTILRELTPDDRMIIERINRFKDKAFAACQELLAKENVPAILVDVEHLFDGESVFFYFLGEVPEKMDGVTARLVEIYDAKIRFRQFAQKLANGCGPGCGTTASQCGVEGTCGKCSLANGCGSKRT